MIGGGADGLDSAKFQADLRKAGWRSAKQALKGLAALQRNLIYARKKPDGGAQKQNAKSTQQRKRAPNSPLIDKGILTDPKQWTVKKRGDSMVLRPPNSRRAAIWINAAAGYDTVFQILPPSFNSMVQTALDKNMEKVKAKARRRNKK